MKIVIVGAGFTGVQLAKLLISEKNQVAVIDNDEDIIRHASNVLDCTVHCADGNNLETLEEVGISKADALVCVTSSDEVNMITCSLVDTVYPDILKIARVRNYAYYVNTANVRRKQEKVFSTKYRPLYGINYMIHPDVEAADAIVQAVENGALGSVTTFDNTNLEIAHLRVSAGSVLDGTYLKDIRGKSDFKFLVVYVEHEGQTSLPSGATKLGAGDTIGVLLDKNNLFGMSTLCGYEHKEFKKITLIGAGRIGTIVSEKLIPKKESRVGHILSAIGGKRSIDYTIVDSNDDLAKAAAEKFPDARVMKADATDENFLREEGILSSDLVICCTHNHEMNMVLAAYLQSLGVKQAVSLVASSAFASIAKKLGVDVPIPLRDSVVDSIMSHLRGKSVKEIHTVKSGQLEIVECEISHNFKDSDKKLKDISDLKSCLLLMSKSSNIGTYQIADGNTSLCSGDHIVLITESENSKKILSYFAGISD